MEIEKNDVLNWFWNFRPDLTVDEDFVEGLHQEFLQANNKLSLDEISFYGFVVSNYKSEIINQKSEKKIELDPQEVKEKMEWLRNNLKVKGIVDDH